MVEPSARGVQSGPAERECIDIRARIQKDFDHLSSEAGCGIERPSAVRLEIRPIQSGELKESPRLCSWPRIHIGAKPDQDFCSFKPPLLHRHLKRCGILETT